MWFTIQKFTKNVPSTTLILKYIGKFSNFMTYVILLQIYSIPSSSTMFAGLNCFFYKLKSKTNKIYLKQTKLIQNMMSIYIYIYILFFVVTIFGGLNVPSPQYVCNVFLYYVFVIGHLGFFWWDYNASKLGFVARFFHILWCIDHQILCTLHL
jgi:hypothetical protein